MQRLILAPLLLFFFFTSGVFGQANFSFTLSPTSGCTPVTVTFTDLSTGATSWNWNFGDGNTSTIQNPTHTYGNAGTYSITLIINGGSSSIIKQITVHGSPTASFTLSNTALCTGSILTITNTSTAGDGVIDSITWDFGDGTVPKTGLLGSLNHTYTDTGTYAVNIIVTNSFGCSNASAGVLIHVRGPLAKFSCSPLAGCQQNLLVTFTNSTKDASPTTVYSWNFGDPASGTNDTTSLYSPSHIFSAFNNYTITLTATDGGCSSIYTFVYSQQALNLVISGVDTVCLGATVFFSDTLSAPTPATHHWNFGDALSGTRDTSTFATTSHVYNTPGLYTISLTDTVNGTCFRTITKTVYVRPLPLASFMADDSTFCKVPDTVNFTGISPNGIKFWTWTFGDPTSGSSDTSYLNNPSHIFNHFGAFTIRVTVTDSFGCVNSFTKLNYIIIQAPTVNITSPADSGCDSIKIFSFNAVAGLVAGDSVVNYLWNFGDGDTLSGTPPVTHTYYSCGVYNVSVTITTKKGCTATTMRPGWARVGNKPTADFSQSATVICYGTNVIFTNQSQPNGCPLTGLDWYSNGSLFSTAQTATYGPPIKCDANITLIVYSNGCPDTKSKDSTLCVHPPRANFFFTYRCDSPLVVAFVDSSIHSDTTIWNWGDGSPNDTNKTNINHVYPSVGTYIVTVYTDNVQYGCLDTLMKTVLITIPIARITLNDSVNCHPFTIFFSGNSSQDGISYVWNFGDPSSGINNVSNLLFPTHTYNTSGFYTVQLVIIDIHGCTDTTTQIIRATGPTAGFIVDSIIGCTPLNVMFTDTSDTSGGALVNYYWNFNYPNMPLYSDTTSSPIIHHTFSQAGRYSILLKVKDSFGCVDSVLKTGFIIATHPNPVFPDSLFLCPGATDSLKVTLGIQTYPKYSVNWNFGDGTGVVTGTNDSTITHQYNGNGIYNLTVTVIDSNGCDSSLSSKVYAFKPTAFFDTASVVDYCGYSSLTLLGDSNNYIDQWAYTVNGPYGLTKHNTTTFDSIFPVSLNYPGTWTATLIVTNIGGCTARIDTPLYIVPGPQGYFHFSPDSGCSPLSVTFYVDSAQNSTYIRYDFVDGVDTMVPNSDSIFTHVYKENNGWQRVPHVYLGYKVGNQNCEIELTNTGDSLLTIISPVSVNITEDSILILEGQKDTLTATPFNNSWSYHWYVLPSHDSLPTLGSPTDAVYTANDGDQYIVLVATDANGCQGYDTVRIVIVPCEEGLKIPNVFTPNGDDLNDTYYIKNLCPITNFLITIYNRWGNVVYKSNDYNFHWDGKDDNGKECSDGVYYYIIHGKKSKLYGYIHLIREK